MPKTKEQGERAAVVLTHGRASQVLATLNEWRGLQFTDSLVAVRVNRLRRQLDDELKPVREEIEALRERLKKEHGKGEGISPDGVKVWNREAERLNEAGAIEVTERFRQEELEVRERDPETKRVREYTVALSPDDIEALGVDELIVLEPKGGD